MKKILLPLLLPVAVFVALVGIWIACGLLFAAISFVGSILESIFLSGIPNLTRAIGDVFSDPWKVLAIPIAIGMAIVFFLLVFGGNSQASDGFIRGRRIGGTNSSRPKYRAKSSTSTGDGTNARNPSGSRAPYRPHR